MAAARPDLNALVSDESRLAQPRIGDRRVISNIVFVMKIGSRWQGRLVACDEPGTRPGEPIERTCREGENPSIVATSRHLETPNPGAVCLFCDRPWL